MIELPKPRVTARPGSWTIDFGGCEGQITELERGGYLWTWDTASGRGFWMASETSRWDLAFTLLWGRAARRLLPEPLDIGDFQLARWASRAESDVGDAAKVLREVLSMRTGLRWSVRRGRGSSSERLRIKAPTARLVDGMMTCRDAALLAALLDRDLVNRRHGATIEPGVGSRTDALCSIAGVPRVPFWDLRRSKCAP